MLQYPECLQKRKGVYSPCTVSLSNKGTYAKTNTRRKTIGRFAAHNKGSIEEASDEGSNEKANAKADDGEAIVKADDGETNYNPQDLFSVEIDDDVAISPVVELLMLIVVQELVDLLVRGWL